MEQLKKIRKELIEQHNNLLDLYEKLEKQSRTKTTAKTRTERIQNSVSTNIEMERIYNRVLVLSRVIDAFDTNISLSKYDTISFSENSKTNLETMKQEISSILNDEYKKLDILSTKKVLLEEFSTAIIIVNGKLNGKYDFSMYQLFGAVISMWCIGAPFVNVVDLPFSLFNVLIPFVVSGLGGAIGTGLILKKRTDEKIDAFVKLNNKLGVDALSLEEDEKLDEYLEIRKLIDKKVHDIMMIVMKEKEIQRLIGVYNSESDKTESKDKSKIREDVLFQEYPELQITEETKRDILEHPEKYVNCDARIRSGMFYTDEEKERYIEESLNRPLPDVDTKEQSGPILAKTLFPPKR